MRLLLVIAIPKRLELSVVAERSASPRLSLNESVHSIVFILSNQDLLMGNFKVRVQKDGHRGISNHLFLLLRLHVQLALLVSDLPPCFGNQLRDQTYLARVLVDLLS